MIEGHFDGVITNGVRDGPGKLTWTNGDTYVGDFKNGLRHGKGVYEEKKAGRRYEGAWVMSQKDGKGVETFANGDTYTGEYVSDMFNGEGELVSKGGKYKGAFKNGLKHGLGVMLFYKANARYEGFWREGRMDGKGLYSWADGKRHEGMWINGERSGLGIMTWPNNDKYDGMFVKNKQHGSGWFRMPNGKFKPGEWKDNTLQVAKAYINSFCFLFAFYFRLLSVWFDLLLLCFCFAFA
jgi:hypothetical protein